MRHARGTIASLSLLLSVAGVGAAVIQQPLFHAGVDVVHIDVSVLDGARAPVRGLTQSDFAVFEDGKPRPIVMFSPVELPPRERTAAGPAVASWTREIPSDVSSNVTAPEGRLVVILFDWSIRFQDQLIARRIATAAVNQLGPGDEAAVVFSSQFANAGTPQDFTADHARLLEAINRPMAAASSSLDKDIRDINGVILDDPEGYESGDCSCRRCVMDTVTQIANLVRDVSGRRKVLLFIGTFFQGYEPTVPTGVNPPTAGSAAGSRGQGGSGGAPSGGPPLYQSPFLKPPGTPPVDIISASKPIFLWSGVCAGTLNDARGAMQRATGLANLTVYVTDPAGLAAPGDDPMGGSTQFSTKRLDDLHIMPDITGGRTIVNTNTPETQVPAIFDESQSYYLIGFERASSVNNGKLHSIDVKVNRHGVTVRTRSGYYANDTLGVEETPATLPLGRSLDRVLPDGEMPLRLTAAAFASGGESPSSVALVISVPDAGGVATGASTNETSLSGTVLAGIFDARGHSVATSQETFTRSHAVGGYEILSRVPSTPGRYEVRVVVETDPGHRGTVYTFVDIPNFATDPVSLSDVVLSALPSVPASSADLFRDLMPLPPTARRTFVPADRVTAFVRAYEGGSGVVEPLTIAAQIMDTAGKTVFSQQEPLSAETLKPTRAADYRLDLPIARLIPAEYVLSVAATERSRQTHRDVRFTIVSGASSRDETQGPTAR